MNVKKEKFSENQFVCLSRSGKWDKENPRLGFAIPEKLRESDGEPTSAFLKRQCTVIGWGGKEGVYETLSNTLTSGFKIINVVSRHSTDNKLFEVVDPRGFILQISSANLMHLVEKCVLNKGVVETPLIWSDKGCLLTEEDMKIAEEYEKSVAEEAFIDTKDIPIGSRIEYKEGHYTKQTGIWLGKHHTVGYTQNGIKFLTSKISYVFADNGGCVWDYEKYVYHDKVCDYTKIKVTKIISKPEESVTNDQAIEIINDDIRKWNIRRKHVFHQGSRLFVAKNKKNLKIDFDEINIKSTNCGGMFFITNEEKCVHIREHKKYGRECFYLDELDSNDNGSLTMGKYVGPYHLPYNSTIKQYSLRINDVPMYDVVSEGITK